MQQTTRRDFLLGSGALLFHVATARVFGSNRAKGRPLAEVRDSLRQLVPDAMRRHNVPGVSLALVRDREIVWAEAFGLRDVEAKAPLSPTTVFEAASLCKPAYAYVVLKQVELGKFDLRLPVMEYLPADVIPEDPRFKKVTAWHLLTHTSGIEPGPPKGRRAKLEFTPGEHCVYSPHGFDFLQVAVERATGEQLGPMMERMLLRPFGLTASTRPVDLATERIVWKRVVSFQGKSITARPRQSPTIPVMSRSTSASLSPAEVTLPSLPAMRVPSVIITSGARPPTRSRKAEVASPNLPWKRRSPV